MFREKSGDDWGEGFIFGSKVGGNALEFGVTAEKLQGLDIQAFKQKPLTVPLDSRFGGDDTKLCLIRRFFGVL